MGCEMESLVLFPTAISLFEPLDDLLGEFLGGLEDPPKALL